MRKFTVAFVTVAFVTVAFMTVALTFGSHAEAAIRPVKVQFQKKKRYLTNGVFVGGEAGIGFSLLGIQRRASKDKRKERIIFQVGDKKGRIKKGQKVGYFHVQVQEKLRRVIIDFAQMKKTALDEDELDELFKTSPLVKKATLTTDPEDGSTNLTLALKRAVKVEVYRSGRSGWRSSRIVLDLVRTKKVRKK